MDGHFDLEERSPYLCERVLLHDQRHTSYVNRMNAKYVIIDEFDSNPWT